MVAGYNGNYIRTMLKAVLYAVEIDVRWAREELKSLVLVGNQEKADE